MVGQTDHEHLANRGKESRTGLDAAVDPGLTHILRRLEESKIVQYAVATGYGIVFLTERIAHLVHALAGDVDAVPFRVDQIALVADQVAQAISNVFQTVDHNRSADQAAQSRHHVHVGDNRISAVDRRLDRCQRSAVGIGEFAAEIEDIVVLVEQMAVVAVAVAVFIDQVIHAVKCIDRQHPAHTVEQVVAEVDQQSVCVDAVAFVVNQGHVIAVGDEIAVAVHPPAVGVDGFVILVDKVAVLIDQEVELVDQHAAHSQQLPLGIDHLALVIEELGRDPLIDQEVADVRLIRIHAHVGQVQGARAEDDIVACGSEHQPAIAVDGFNHVVITSGQSSVDIGNQRPCSEQ